MNCHPEINLKLFVASLYNTSNRCDAGLEIKAHLFKKNSAVCLLCVLWLRFHLQCRTKIEINLYNNLGMHDSKSEFTCLLWNRKSLTDDSFSSVSKWYALINNPLAQKEEKVLHYSKKFTDDSTYTLCTTCGSVS